MLLLNYDWLDYAIFDENGDMIGVRNDIPKEIKEQYYTYLEMLKERNGKIDSDEE